MNIIPEEALDDMVHSIAGQLKSHGVELDTDQLCDLNDTIGVYLEDKCDIVSIQQ